MALTGGQWKMASSAANSCQKIYTAPFTTLLGICHIYEITNYWKRLKRKEKRCFQVISGQKHRKRESCNEVLQHPSLQRIWGCQLAFIPPLPSVIADYLWDVVTNTVLMVEITGFCFYASHKSYPLTHCMWRRLLEKNRMAGVTWHGTASQFPVSHKY